MDGWSRARRLDPKGTAGGWKEVGPNSTVETLKEGRLGKPMEMQGRTLLCGGKLAFILMVPRCDREKWFGA